MLLLFLLRIFRLSMSRWDRASEAAPTFFFLAFTQILLHILQGIKASMYAKRGLKLLIY
jgi:hypothetical protein